MPKGTREKILAAALEMFSENGYAGTNMRELMASIGYAKSSTYRHFGSKEELWNSLLDEMTAYYEMHFGSPERLPPVPDSPEELVSMTMRMAAFTIHDRKVVMTRKLLTIEQFRDDCAKALATKHFLTGLSEMFSRVFSGMMDKGLLRREDPSMLAFAFTTPISALIRLCDREPEKTGSALAQIEAYARHFIDTYRAPGGQV
jgi:AcrR family transcriptional regulator